MFKVRLDNTKQTFQVNQQVWFVQRKDIAVRLRRNAVRLPYQGLLMPGYQNWNMGRPQKAEFAGPTPALGTTCCFANNPVDGFDASRVTTARGFTPMLSKRTTIHEGDTHILWGCSLKARIFGLHPFDMVSITISSILQAPKSGGRILVCKTCLVSSTLTGASLRRLYELAI